MSSPNPTSNKQRRHDIFRTARAIFVGGKAQANDRTTIKKILSQNPTMFESVVNRYGSDEVVDIVSSLIDNGTLTSKPNVQLAFRIPQHLSGVRDRQHAVLEQAAAHSEAMALGEASQSDLAIHECDQGDEQIDVTGYTLSLMIGESAKIFAKEPGQSRTLPQPYPPSRQRCFPHICRTALSTSC